LLATTRWGARALRRDDVGHLSPGARSDAVVLSAPSYSHLIYRPGVPLIAATVIESQVVWADPEAGFTPPASSAAAASGS
jgi:imidazolonepropionase